MLRQLLVVALAAACLQAAERKPTRPVLKEAEARFDAMIQRQWTEDPLVLLGNTRAVYIEGYGVVMTAELNLVTGPTVSPFNPTISKETIAVHREKKLKRLPQLRQLLKTAAETARSWFPDLPENESVVVGVTLLKYVWEDPAGLPAQVLAVTSRRANSPVKMQEN